MRAIALDPLYFFPFIGKKIYIGRLWKITMDSRPLGTLLILILLIETTLSIGISLSPATYSMRDALKGGETYAEFRVGNNNPYAITVKASVVGEIADFSEIDGAEFEIAPQMSRDFRVYIRPPATAAVGEYEGKVSVTITGADIDVESEGTGVAVKLGASALMKVDVTGTEVKKMGFAAGIRLSETEYPLPARLDITARNTGNVEIRPLAILDVYGIGGNVLKTYELEGEKVKPQESLHISETLDISPFPAGNYTTLLRVYPDAISFRRGDAPSLELNTLLLVIYPRGTLSIIGNLRDLEVIGSEAGNPMKITGFFTNNGQQILNAKLVAEVYSGETLRGVVESKEMESRPGNEIELVAYYTPPGNGEYVVNAYVQFGIKSSNVVSKSIVIGRDMDPLAVSGAIIALAVAIIAVYKIFLRPKPEQKKTVKKVKK